MIRVFDIASANTSIIGTSLSDIKLMIMHPCLYKITNKDLILIVYYLCLNVDAISTVIEK